MRARGTNAIEETQQFPIGPYCRKCKEPTVDRFGPLSDAHERGYCSLKCQWQTEGYPV